MSGLRRAAIAAAEGTYALGEDVATMGRTLLYVDPGARHRSRWRDKEPVSLVVLAVVLVLLLLACVAAGTGWLGSRLIDGPTFGAVPVPVSPSAL